MTPLKKQNAKCEIKKEEKQNVSFGFLALGVYKHIGGKISNRQDLLNFIIEKKLVDEKLTEKLLNKYKKSANMLPVSEEYVEYNIRAMCEYFEEMGLDKNQYIESILKNTELLYRNPDMIKRSFKYKGVKTKENEKKEILKIFSKAQGDVQTKREIKIIEPTEKVFAKYSKDVVQKLSESDTISKETGAKILDHCKNEKNMRLRMAMPIDDIIKNIDNIKKIKDIDFDIEKYLEAGCKSSFLFLVNAQKMEKFITDVAKYFEKSGMTKQECYDMGVKTPLLMYRTPEKIIEYANKKISHCAKYGLTEKKYLDMVRSNPKLLTGKPETFIEAYRRQAIEILMADF